MRLLNIIGGLLAFCQIAFAQQNYYSLPLADYAEKQKIINKDSIKISLNTGNFYTVYNHYFTKAIALNSENASPANYFGFEPTNSTATVNFSYPYFNQIKFKNSNCNIDSAKILRFIASGSFESGFENNIIKVIADKKITPTTKFSLAFSFPVKSNFWYDPIEMRQKSDLIHNTKKYFNDLNYIDTLKIRKLTYEIQLLIADTGTISKRIRDTDSILKIEIDPDKIKQLQYQLLELQSQLQQINIDLANKQLAGNSTSQAEQFKAIRKKQLDSLHHIDVNFNYTSIRLIWADVFSNITREKFKLLNDTATLTNFKKQVIDTAFTGFEAGIAINILYTSRYKSLKSRILKGYIRFSYSIIRENTRSEMKEIAVTEQYKSTDSTDKAAVRQISKSFKDIYNNINGDYQEVYFHKFSLDIFKFMTYKNWLALHFMNTYQLAFKKDTFEKGRCMSTVGIGVVFSAINQKKDKTILNIEPYIKFNDVFNVNKSINTENNTSKLRQRNEIGLKLNVPLPSFVKPKDEYY